MSTSVSAFRAIRTVGTVLPAEALARGADLKVPGQTAADYQLTPGMTVNAAVARAWDAVLGAHRAWTTALDKLPPGDPATALTRDRWLLPLLYELGWGRPTTLAAGLDVPPGLGESEPTHFPVSHRLSWPSDTDPQVWVPLQLVGAGVALDTRTPGVAARAPQSMLQDYLNREDHSLWGMVSNGHLLRVLRDASALTKQSYVEFDLDDILSNQRYADFRLFFLTAHASRFAPHQDEPTVPAEDTDDEADDAAAETAALRHETCWLEQWRTTGIADGARALLTLQHGVATALQELGTGFVGHPGNTELRQVLAAAPDASRDLHRALLRIAYRLIVLFVTEDRGLLHAPGTPTGAAALYDQHFSTRRLRALATSRTGTRHTDLWDAHLIVTDALAGDGLHVLGLNGMGDSLFGRSALSVLAGARLPNRSLLSAVRALAQIVDPSTGVPRSVDYRNLDSEELGGMYEGLLAYTPRYDPDARTFTLQTAAGNDRKTSGSYYTPTALISLVLDEALTPLIADAVAAPDPEAALLAITVVDPAVGSGHFVVAAGRRIAAALATVRTQDAEPGPTEMRTATADVVERCLYGVDLNDLAIEITKVALWLEAFDATRPFPFLDAHFRVGNALLGVTPELLRHNIPDTALTVLGGDDKEWTKKLMTRNKTERVGQDQLQLGFGDLNVETAKFTAAAHVADQGRAGSLAAVRRRADAWRALEADPDLRSAKLTADAWCAAHVQHKTPDHGQGITHRVLSDLAADPSNVAPTVLADVQSLARQYRFLHWHLEFPGIFTTDQSTVAGTGPGWTGGFSCVVGNPPWETLQTEDKKFFANVGRNDIADSANASLRQKMISSLSDEDPPLYQSYLESRRQSEGTTHLVRSGRYPFTATGKINTYSVFAETMRMLVGARGTVGIITPTGLGTDKTTSAFFDDTLSSGRLLAFYDFENEAKIFKGVDHRVRFAVTAMSGPGRTAERSRFAFLTRHLTDVPARRFALTPSEVLTMNPNTGTLPMFRTRLDADITLGIYQRHCILIQDGTPDGNPWGLSFSQGLFNMASASGLFVQPEALADAPFNGWSYERDGAELLPLYEAKMLSHYDHRFSTYRDATQAQLNVGSLPRPTTEQHDDPDLEPLARYWVPRTEVTKALGDKWDRDWFLGWRDITNAGNERTFVPSVMPASAVGHVFPLAFPKRPEDGALLHAAWSSMVSDYVARQKLSGTHMTYGVMKQLACPPPSTFDATPPWATGLTLDEWVRPYVLELSYTSWRLQPYAQELGDDGPPFHWDPDRRAELRADLEAAFLHVYGLARAEAEHVLDSFFVVRKYEERDLGEYRTRRLAMEAYDRMAAATARGGHGWTPLADIPAGHGPRHPARDA